jgi:hypothetical protein
MPTQALTSFEDELGRPCYRIQPSDGGLAGIVLQSHYQTMRRCKITREWKWNDDGHRNEEGNLFRDYLKTKAKEPGRRGRKNKDQSRTASRLLVMAVMLANGARFPKKGYEVAFVDLDRRHDLRPENLKLRPRGENKHWVNAVRAFGREFDPVTGFDQE